MGGVTGQRILRREDDRFLRGRGEYLENIRRPGALFATFVRSPYAHARICGIDVSAVAAVPGARVFTANEIDLPPAPPPFPDLEQRMARPFLASDVVRFVGEAVAVVLTDSRSDGVDAAELVQVDYEPLAPVIDPEHALTGDVLLFPECGTNVCAASPGDGEGEGLFDGCEVVVSGRLVSQRLAACPLETRGCLAEQGEDGRMTVWLSTQTPHRDRQVLGSLLGIGNERVRVIAPDVGGGFGAKLLGAESVVVPWLARHTGRPVRWAESRSENMVAMPHGRSAVLELTIGGSREGHVQAYRLRIVQDAGAYPGVGAGLPGLTALMASGVYAIPRIETDTVSVITNTTPLGAYRGAGRPEAAQAIERAMDLFAAEIGLDPVEVRRRNLITPDAFPYTTASGARYDCGAYERALDLALQHAGYERLRDEQRERRARRASRALGIGVSTYVEITNALVEPEFGGVEITPEGGAVLRTGSFSHGQGHETTFAMIVADRLGLPVDAVRVVKGDTDLVPRGAGTFGSKSTQIGGAAAAAAARIVAERALALAADQLEASVDDIVLDADAGGFHVAGSPVPSLSWRELAAGLHARGRLGELSAEQVFRADTSTFPFGAHVAVVEIDTETGEVDLLRLVAVDDAGTIVNPLVAEGQVHGGLAAGVGQALFEGMEYDEDGNPLTGTFLGYAFPSAADLPGWELVSMETPTPVNALGAKGIGESGTIGATPAVHSAVLDALAPFGVRHVEMPIGPERVWRALQEARASATATS